MKIGITTFGGDGGKSGISQYIINLIREFSFFKDIFEFEVLVYEDEKDIFLRDCDNISGLFFPKKISPPVINIAWHQVSLGRLCKERKYDLLFLPAGNRRLPYSLPCPSVGTVHDLSSLHVEGKYNKFRQIYIFRALPMLIRKLTKVITISESSKKDIIDYVGVADEDIIVTPLGANDSIYYPRDKEKSFKKISIKYNIQKPYILYISRIEHPGKNHVKLIEAFSDVRKDPGIHHQLVLAGSDWNRSEVVHKTAKESSFSEDIIFTGYVPDPDIPDLYCGADLFVFPSLFEGFGLPLLEAMKCGTPVACSNISSLPEVAGDAAVLFDPYAVESIAGAVSLMLTNAERRSEYIRKGLERSRHFSWENTAQQTIEVFKSIL